MKANLNKRGKGNPTPTPTPTPTPDPVTYKNWVDEGKVGDVKN